MLVVYNKLTCFKSNLVVYALYVYQESSNCSLVYTNANKINQMLELWKLVKYCWKVPRLASKNYINRISYRLLSTRLCMLWLDRLTTCTQIQLKKRLLSILSWYFTGASGVVGATLPVKEVSRFSNICFRNTSWVECCMR
jgi:hypothetical protein